ncbi:hypothetical protein OG21DRAFT_1508724 [Imleria badia]|nr:hypothetical protein OG21DRAFT_1508724 [Imleria badia]
MGRCWTPGYPIGLAYRSRGTCVSSFQLRLPHDYLQDIMIVETDWPAVCNTTATPLSESTVPAGIEGHIIWTEDISAVLNNVNLDYGDKALGIVYWEPGWIGNPALGSACADNLSQAVHDFWNLTCLSGDSIEMSMDSPGNLARDVLCRTDCLPLITGNHWLWDAAFRDRLQINCSSYTPPSRG